MTVADEATHSDHTHSPQCEQVKVKSRLSWRRLKSDSCLPADVVGLARGLQFQTVGSLFFFVRADGNDGLPPAFRTCRLIVRWAWAEQHAVAVFRRNLWGIWIKFHFQSQVFFLFFFTFTVIFKYIYISATLKKMKPIYLKHKRWSHGQLTVTWTIG